MKGRLWLAQALAVVLALAVAATPAAAQTETGSLQAAFGGLQSVADLLAEGLDNPAVARARAQQALNAGLEVRAQLEAILQAQPESDFVRSRAQAVLDQTNEAIGDLQEGLDNPDLLAAKLREAEGQILEAIEELRPALPEVPAQRAAVEELPKAGGVPFDAAVVALAGAAAVAAGVATRRLALKRS